MEIIFGNKYERLTEEKYFLASADPVYYGLIVNPSSELWGYMVENRSIKSDISGALQDYNIPYRIDVGENSIFFIKPETSH
jgi:hypothetical protein